MIKYLLILFLFGCGVTKQVNKPAPAPILNPAYYYFNWKSIAHETGLINYKIQQSSNNRNWSTVATIYPKYAADSNVYSYKLPTPQYSRYYKIVATAKVNNKTTSYQTEPIYVKVTK